MLRCERGILKNSRLEKVAADVGKVKVNPPKADEKRWLFASHRAINWLNFVLPTFGNTNKAERNEGIEERAKRHKEKSHIKLRESEHRSPLFFRINDLLREGI